MYCGSQHEVSGMQKAHVCTYLHSRHQQGGPCPASSCWPRAVILLLLLLGCNQAYTRHQERRDWAPLLRVARKPAYNDWVAGLLGRLWDALTCILLPAAH